MPNNFYGVTSLTGGAGALDAIDGANLADLDAAFVVTLSYIYFYSLDADSAAAENSPYVISPNTNAGNKRWILTGINQVTATEFQQLENMGTTTISAAQWTALGALVEWTDWTPTLTRLSGYTHARYFRIGDLCFFEFSAEGKNATGSGYIRITLPFTHANTGQVACNGVVYDGAAWVGYTHITIPGNTNYIQVFKTAATGTWAGTETGICLRIAGFFEIA
jgi:hypothetical protein